jgi:hypothetical protein
MRLSALAALRRDREQEEFYFYFQLMKLFSPPGEINRSFQVALSNKVWFVVVEMKFSRG